MLQRNVEHLRVGHREVLVAPVVPQEHAGLCPAPDLAGAQRDRIDLQRVRDLLELRGGDARLAGLDRFHDQRIDTEVADPEALASSLRGDGSADRFEHTVVYATAEHAAMAGKSPCERSVTLRARSR
jgi:hypothetical protein